MVALVATTLILEAGSPALQSRAADCGNAGVPAESFLVSRKVCCIKLDRDVHCEDVVRVFWATATEGAMLLQMQAQKCR